MAVPSRLSALLGGMLGNSALRAATVGARALLMVVLAVWLEPAELGYFGLITAIISFTNYLFGLDFYTFVVRDISAKDTAGLRHKLRDQFVLHGVLYGAAVLASWWVVPALGLERSLLIVVLLLAITQHVTLEMYRLLVRLHRAMAASVAFFLRDAAWIPFCLLLWWFHGAITLTTILGFWLGASVISIAYSAWVFRGATVAGPMGSVDWQRLRRGLVVGLRMLPGTLSLRSLFSVDRMVLAMLVAPDVLGAYVFFVGICMTFQGLFESGVLTYFWPPLLEAEKQGDQAAVQSARRRLFRMSWGGSAMVILTSWTVGLVAVQLLPNPIYGEHIALLFVAAVGYGVLGMSNGPHFLLFSKGKDGQIVGSHLAGLLVFGVSAAVFSQFDPRLAVPAAVLVASATILASKGWWTRRVLQDEASASL